MRKNQNQNKNLFRKTIISRTAAVHAGIREMNFKSNFHQLGEGGGGGGVAVEEKWGGVRGDLSRVSVAAPVAIDGEAIVGAIWLGVDERLSSACRVIVLRTFCARTERYAAATAASSITVSYPSEEKSSSERGSSFRRHVMWLETSVGRHLRHVNVTWSLADGRSAKRIISALVVGLTSNTHSSAFTFYDLRWLHTAKRKPMTVNQITVVCKTRGH